MNTSGRRQHWLAAVMAAGLLGLACTQSWAIAIIKGPYLQNVTETSMVVMWETDTAATGTVEYGPTAAYGSTATDTGTETIHEVTVTGLTADSVYHYRAISGTAVSSDATLETAPPPGVPFRFAAYGDTRSQPAEHQAVITRMVASAPRMALHSGDAVADGSNYSLWQSEFFGPASALMRDTPMAMALGNHENNSHWWYDFFSNPPDSGTEAWYAFRYGDARFIILDTDQNYATGSAQYNWLVSALSAPTDAIWTFVCFHHPPYASGGHSGDTGVQTYLVPLFEQYGVDIVFNGHCHNYERSIKSGIVYIVTGGGGAPLADINTYPNPYQVYAEKVYHHCVIDIDGGTLTCRGVRASNGTEFDEFSLTRTATATSPTLPAGWNLISLPLRPQDPDPAVVFAGITIDHTLYRYDTAAGSYVMYLDGDPGDVFGPVDSSSGYWLYLSAPAVISYEAIQRATPQYVALPSAGWRLIGHPRTAATGLSSLRVRDETTGNVLGLSIARTMGWVGTPLYAYDNATSGYLTIGFEPWRTWSALEPWYGYWFVTHQDDLSLIVPAL